MDRHSEISLISLEHFNNLPKTGKPKQNEWTVLSCIVQEDTRDHSFEVVALGTGSKCRGESNMSANGDVLNDSHAEVICRRNFLKYLYLNMTQLSSESVISYDGAVKKFKVQNNFLFHFFTTHVPCGDATIFSKQSVDDVGKCLDDCNLENTCNKNATSKSNIIEQDHNVNCDTQKRLHINNVSDLPASKKFKLTSKEEENNCKEMKCRDIFRTGAKCLIDDVKQDPKLSGSDYHRVGAIRTKPGRLYW